MEQGNTPTLPGYTRDELIGFQTSDSTLKWFRAFWERGRRPGPKESTALSSQVKRLCVVKTVEKHTTKGQVAIQGYS